MFGSENNAIGTAYDSPIFASTLGMVPKNITIKADVEDTGNTGAVKVLRRGLILVPLTSGGDAGYFVVYDPAGLAGEQLADQAVVLLDTYEMDGVNPVIANAAIAGTFWKDMMIVDSDFWLAATIKPGTLRFAQRNMY